MRKQTRNPPDAVVPLQGGCGQTWPPSLVVGMIRARLAMIDAAVLALVLLSLVSLAGDEAWAHGESVRGSGGSTLNTVGGETSEGISASVRYDQRDFARFSDQELLDFRRVQSEDVHQHEREQSVFLSVAAGITEDWDLYLQLPFKRFSNFRDNGDDFAVSNDTISATDVSQGLGDLLIFGKYRFWEANDHHLAVLAGIKLPTGRVRERTNAGDTVGTHNQPGSGSVDFQLGGAYTGHFFDGALGLSADLIGRINTEGAGSFRSGNSVQADLAISYRPHARLVPVAELNLIAQERDTEENEVKRNSGARSLFLSVGALLSLTERQSAFGVFSVPLWQDLPGIQNDEDFRFSVGYGVGF